MNDSNSSAGYVALAISSAVAALALALGAAAVPSAAAAPKKPPAPASTPAAPVALPEKTNLGPVEAVGAQRFDFESKITGRAYRVFVTRGGAPDRSKPAPVVYVLDGNAYFALVADAHRYWSTFGDGIAPAIVVGIGYPTDSVPEMMKRRLTDLTPSPPPADDPHASKFLPPDATFGDVDRFLEMIDRELKPLIAAENDVDAANSVLIGHSLGGLTVLRALYRRPGSYRTFVALSPSIWWNRRVVLQDEPAFLERVRSRQFAGRVYVGVGAAEEHLFDPPPPGMSAQDALQLMGDARMVGNARAFARRLEAAGGTVRYEEFAGHTHLSLPWVALRPALELALPAAAP